MSFDIEKYYEDLERKTLFRRNFVQFILGVIALLTPWISFHFFNSTIVDVGLGLLLGFILFKTGGWDYVKALHSFSSVEKK